MCVLITIQPGEEYRVGDCTAIGPHYDPTGMGPTNATGYSANCTPDTPIGCEVGDLTGKHDTVDVSGKQLLLKCKKCMYIVHTVLCTFKKNLNNHQNQ